MSTRFKCGFGTAFAGPFYSRHVGPGFSQQESGLQDNFYFWINRPGFTLQDVSLRQIGWPGNLDRANWDPLTYIAGTGTENDGIQKRFLNGHMLQTVTPDPGTWRHNTGTMTGFTQYEWLWKFRPYSGLLDAYVYGDYGTNGFGPHSGFHLNSGTGVDPVSGWGEAGYYSVDTVTSDTGLVATLNSNDRVTVQQTRVISMEFRRVSDDAPFGTLSVTQVFDGDFRFCPLPTDRWNDLQRLYEIFKAQVVPNGPMNRGQVGNATFDDDGLSVPSLANGGQLRLELVRQTINPDFMGFGSYASPGWGFYSQAYVYMDQYWYLAGSGRMRGSRWVSTRTSDLDGNIVGPDTSTQMRYKDYYEIVDQSETIERTFHWFTDFPQFSPNINNFAIAPFQFATPDFAPKSDPATTVVRRSS